MGSGHDADQIAAVHNDFVDAFAFTPGFEWQAASGGDRSGYVTVTDGLQWLLDHFGRVGAKRHGRLWHGPYPDLGAHVYWVAGKTVVVSGDTAQASAVRDLLPFAGWAHAVLPVGSTPLEALRPLVPIRVFNLLARQRFATVEEVAAVPDIGLYEIRLMGQPSIDGLRAAIASTRTALSSTAATSSVILEPGQVHELVSLLSALTGYAEARQHREIADRATAFLAVIAATA